MSENEIIEKPKKKRGGQPGNKGGRPPILILNDDTIKKIVGLGKIQVTTEEAAAVMGVTRGAFEQFLSRNEKAREAFENGKQEGKAALRRLQMHAAQNGNTTMLIWLGKQFLGQREKNEVTGKDGGAIQHEVSGSIDLLVSKLTQLTASEEDFKE